MNETFFFRQREELDAIDWHALLRRARRGSQEVRVWVAACATGEEAYTLALLASETLGASPPAVRAGDGHLRAALAAGAARTLRRALGPQRRAGPARAYFERDGEQLAVGTGAASLVTFRAPEPRNGTVPPRRDAFDLILCRNVLIYFDGETADRVVDGLRSALRPEGTLILGSADVLCGSARRLVKLESIPTRGQRTPAFRFLSASRSAWWHRPKASPRSNPSASKRAFCRGSPSSRAVRHSRPPSRCGTSSTSTPLLAWLRLRSAALTRRQAIPAQHGVHTSKHSARSTWPTTGTITCSSKSTSSTSRRHVGLGWRRTDEPRDRLFSNAVSSAFDQSDTIVVADDSMTILAMTSSRLERAGYDIVTATRGDDALKLVQEHRPRLVLLDVEMPGLSGVEVTRRIRADESLAGTSIVLLTSLSEETDIATGIEAGADAYLTKPFSPQELQTQVEKLIGTP